MRDEDADERIYRVVVNHEEQYSIWLLDRDLPGGWRDAGKSGTKPECLAHIGEVWTDMRPLSLRRRMDELAAIPPPPQHSPESRRSADGRDDLVARLESPQAVEAALRPARELRYFREQLQRGYVFMRFTATGTEIGIRLDRAACDLAAADGAAARGMVALAGDLVLNYNRVRYRGELDLETLTGTGRLEFVAAVESSAT